MSKTSKRQNQRSGVSRPEVSIIILNWNEAEMTVNCVRSVIQQQKSFDGTFEIILVDNGSVDGSLERFTKEFGEHPLVHLVDAQENKGYAGGNNLGVRKSRGTHVVILNNDTIVEEGWLQHLIDVLRKDKSVGAVNSLEVRNYKRIDLNKLKTHFSAPNVLQYGVLLQRKDPCDNIDVINSYTIKGCSFAYRRSITDVPFDEDYFIFSEDTKLGWIIRSRGYHIKTATKSVVNHLHNMTEKKNSAFGRKAVYLKERNRLMNLLTFYELWTTAKMLPFLLAQTAATNLMSVRKIPLRAKAYWYLATHPQQVWKKRREIQATRTKTDAELLPHGWTFYPRSSEEYKLTETKQQTKEEKQEKKDEKRNGDAA